MSIFPRHSGKFCPSSASQSSCVWWFNFGLIPGQSLQFSGSWSWSNRLRV
jgi:hypothetical protein